MTQQHGKGPAGSQEEPTALPHSASSLALPLLASSIGFMLILDYPAGAESHKKNIVVLLAGEVELWEGGDWGWKRSIA